MAGGGGLVMAVVPGDAIPAPGGSLTLHRNSDGAWVYRAMIVFVFGSNLAGRHGKGAALEARRMHGAKYGQAVGLQGNSYAIPTKDEHIRTLPLDRIKPYVDEFILFARGHPTWTFNVTAIGCGLAGYTPKDIAPMFALAPENCILPDEFTAVIRGMLNAQSPCSSTG
jgi:hypothetical protein